MHGLLKKVYDRAKPLRPIMASGYGFLVKRWRYGPETEEQVSAALERELWTPEQWRRYQSRRLSELLHHAATQVPYYREQWQERRRQGDLSPWDDLANWPLLRKEELRRRPEAFLADTSRRSQLFQQSTSGSTGTPVITWRSRTTMRSWYALAEARWRRWYGVSGKDRWGMLGGKLVVPFQQEEPPFWVFNRGLNQLYLSTFHLKPENAPAYRDAIARYEVRYLYGYASSMYTLARSILEQDLAPVHMKVAISNAEPLHPHQRQAIAKAFGCEVRDTYGMSEAVAAASECEQGTMHLWPEVGLLEVFRDEVDEPAPEYEEGRLVCTSWLNADMPLIRYEVGDRGALSHARRCPCGRSLPQLRSVIGRLSDNLVTADGRRVFQLDHVFYELRVKEAQIIQDELERLRVNVVPAADYSEQDASTIVQRLQERVGQVSVEIRERDVIERERNGKFRAVISNVG